jgi:DNA polymerase-3 subunit delta
MPSILNDVLSQDVANFAVFLAGDLPSSSAIRKAFEKFPLAVAIPCYREESRDIAQFATHFLRESGYLMDQEAMQYVCQAFYGDHLLLKSELQKLMLYCGDAKQITIEDVRQSVSGLVELSLQDICMHTATGDLHKAQKEAELMGLEGIPVIAILRSLINYYTKLYEMRAQMADSGKTEQQIVDAQRPPLFFKIKPTYIQHLRKWTSPRIAGALRVLHTAEGECKKTGAQDTLLLSRVLLKIGKMA